MGTERRAVRRDRDSVRNRVRQMLEADGPLTSREIAERIGELSLYASAVCAQLETLGEVERVLCPGAKRMSWRIKKVNWKEESHA